ncbi:MAG: 5'-nucleotidase C-terminal domain-containing protein [Nitriliruptoraceae bacterium]
MMRRTLSVLSVAALAAGVLSLPAVAQDAPADDLTGCPDGAVRADFEDVATTNVHADSIDCVAERGVVSGVSLDPPLFEPASPATRGQITAMLARALRDAGIELPDATVPPFADAVGTTHATDIAQLAAARVVRGFDEDTFGPNRAVTRAQIASMVTASHGFALGMPTPAEGGPYFDDYASGTHSANVDAAFELGLVVGRDADTFAPDAAVRRDQVASFVNRLLGAVDAMPEAAQTVTVLHVNDGESMLLNDVDSGFPGAARFVADMHALQDAADEGDDRSVVTISSGDNFLAGPRFSASTASYDEGGPFYDALVYLEAGFDAMTIGNHEFDFGPDRLADFITAVEGVPFLSANLDVSPEPSLDALGDRIAGSTVIEPEPGVEVGVIGATYEELDTVSSPRDVIVDEVLPAVQAEVDALQAAGVEIILLSSHLQDLNEELTLVPQLSGVDAVIGGGGGERLADYPLFAEDADGQQVPVVTTPGNYADIGQLALGFDEDGELARIERADSALLPVAVDGPQDETMLEQVEGPVSDYTEALETNVIATSEVPLDGRRGFVRTRETNLGSLLADALLETAQNEAASYGVPEADVALQNGGGIRNDAVIEAGGVTELDTFNVAAFFNIVGVMEIDGDRLVELLEYSVAEQPEPAGRHGQWAGVEFTFDVDEPVGSRLVDATVTKSDATEVELVADGVTVAGDEPFTIASIDFLLAGGDDYPFGGLDFTRVGVTYQQALADRISALGTITAADYPDLTVEFDRYDRFGPVGSNFL